MSDPRDVGDSASGRDHLDVAEGQLGADTGQFDTAAQKAQATYIPGRVGIVSLGLIGGSFARAFSAAGREVYAWNRTRATLELAMIETVTGELNDKTVATCELIVLAGYAAFSVDWLREWAPFISPGAIVIDAVGVKRMICSRCFDIAQKWQWYFVGCHPMAGTQFSGFAHARANMFRGAPMVVVPPKHMDDIERFELLERLQFLLGPCGFGSWTLTSPTNHDRVIAYTSQLAHIVSNAYVKSPTALDHKGFSGGSYRDLTRVARLNAPMWTELFLDNADFLSVELATLITNLEAYKDALDARDASRLEALLAEGDQRKKEADAKNRGEVREANRKRGTK